MITVSTGELYKQAQVLANCYNSDFMTFQSAIDLLNARYRILYDKIVQSDSDFYVHEIVFDENDFVLPDDLYNIKSVRLLSSFDDSWTPLERQPSKSYVAGTYNITNNVFHYNGQLNKKVQIRYNPMPKTLTMPFASEEIIFDVEPESFGKMYDDGIYYTGTDQKKYFYNFGTKSSSEAENYKEYVNPYEIDYEAQTVVNEDGEDISDYFTAYGTFNAIYVDEDYAMASYDDGKIYVFTCLDGTEWNIKVSTGHSTKGKIFGLHTDDTTGYGCIFYDYRDDKYYRAPFVTDTVLSFSNNTLFYLLEVELGILLSNIAGTEMAESLTNEEGRATDAFYNEIRQNKAGALRVNNVTSRGLLY